MVSTKFSDARIRPVGGDSPTNPAQNINRDCVLPNAPIWLGYAHFPREQGTQENETAFGVMNRPRHV